MHGIIGGTQFLDKPDYDSVYPRSVDMSEPCVTGLVFSCRTLMFATTMAEGSWQHGTACAICPCGANRGAQRVLPRICTDQQLEDAISGRSTSLACQDWLEMGNWTVANLQLPHGLS